jgi:NADH-quinone oxidoreductase subunit F
VISAVSQESELDFLGDGVETKWGRVTVNRSLATSHPKVWAGGDAISGPAMVIDAIKAGQDAAESIDRALRAAAGDPAYVAPEHEKIEVPFDVDEDAADRLQAAMPETDAEARRRDFSEVELGLTREQAVAEAARCMRCDLMAKEGGGSNADQREATG